MSNSISTCPNSAEALKRLMKQRLTLPISSGMPKSELKDQQAMKHIMEQDLEPWASC
jgi:hypothetical protein